MTRLTGSYGAETTIDCSFTTRWVVLMVEIAPLAVLHVYMQHQIVRYIINWVIKRLAVSTKIYSKKCDRWSSQTEGSQEKNIFQVCCPALLVHPLKFRWTRFIFSACRSTLRKDYITVPGIYKSFPPLTTRIAMWRGAPSWIKKLSYTAYTTNKWEKKNTAGLFFQSRKKRKSCSQCEDVQSADSGSRKNSLVEGVESAFPF